MSDKYLNDFERVCWSLAKEHFKALDKEHIIRMIEHSANKRINNELDSQEFKRVGQISRPIESRKTPNVATARIGKTKIQRHHRQ